MRFRSCTLRRIKMPLREPMRTSYAEHRQKDVILVELQTAEGVVGIAECVAMAAPTYTEETVETAWHILKDFLIPRLNLINDVTESSLHMVIENFSAVRGHAMAKAGLEMAIWDAFSAANHIPLHQLIGGEIRDVPVGISVGMDADVARLVHRALEADAAGYRRIKLKIAPGEDVGPLRAIRNALPNMQLMVDANSAYKTVDDNWISEMDELRLEMIEQPLSYDDMIDHAVLQTRLKTPICLDESIHCAADVRRAAAIGACRIINLKPGRVGGFSAAIQVHDMAVGARMGLWCGGMYETGIGRLHNLALCSLPGFTSPTDNGPSDRYFERDIVDPPVRFFKPGYLRVESLCGVVARVDWEWVQHVTVATETILLDPA